MTREEMEAEIARLRAALERVGDRDVFAAMLLSGKLKAAYRYLAQLKERGDAEG